MVIIKDLRIINAIAKKYDLKFDKKFKYCISNKINLNKKMYIQKKEYIIKFFDGCFYPYLVKIDTK